MSGKINNPFESFGDGGYDEVGGGETGHEIDLMGVIDKVVFGLESRGVEPTILPAVKIDLFNMLFKCALNRVSPSGEIEKSISRYEHWSRVESVARSTKGVLPSIGIEIEVPIDFIDERSIFVLNKIGIPNDEETVPVDRPVNLHEINPSPTYSAWTSNRILQGLVGVGAIPIHESEESGKREIENEEPLSLHINFGIPYDLFRAGSSSIEFFENEHIDYMYILSDAMNIAFTSERRLKMRKTNESVLTKDDSVDSSYNSVAYRVELRAQEFKDYTTCRMMVESQYLAACLFAGLKSLENIRQDVVGDKLSDLWSVFCDDSVSVLRRYGIEKRDIIRKNRGKVASSIISQNPSLVVEMRKLFTCHARSAMKIIAQK